MRQANQAYGTTLASPVALAGCSLEGSWLFQLTLQIEALVVFNTNTAEINYIKFKLNYCSANIWII